LIGNQIKVSLHQVLEKGAYITVTHSQRMATIRAGHWPTEGEQVLFMLPDATLSFLMWRLVLRYGFLRKNRNEQPGFAWFTTDYWRTVYGFIKCAWPDARSCSRVLPKQSPPIDSPIALSWPSNEIVPAIRPEAT
jgi:hypothetical protein